MNAVIFSLEQENLQIGNSIMVKKSAKPYMFKSERFPKTPKRQLEIITFFAQLFKRIIIHKSF